MKRVDLTSTCAGLFRSRVASPALRTPELESVDTYGDEAFGTADSEENEVAGYLEYHPANDEDEFAIAAE